MNEPEVAKDYHGEQARALFVSLLPTYQINSVSVFDKSKEIVVKFI